jgi:hypothetical protein
LLGVEVVGVHLCLAIINRFLGTVLFAGVGCGCEGKGAAAVTAARCSAGVALLQQLLDWDDAIDASMRGHVDDWEHL